MVNNECRICQDVATVIVSSAFVRGGQLLCASCAYDVYKDDFGHMFLEQLERAGVTA